MSQTAIFGPVFAMFALTLAVWLYMYAKRIPFIQSLDPDIALTPAKLAELSPPAVANPSDNLKNLFEMPTIFYAVVLYLHATGKVDALYLGAAWTFFAFRLLHSLVHCSFNLVPLRFVLYVISALALWFMVARMALAV